VSPELALGLELADLADAIALPRFRAADLVVTTKPDLTPVSEADRAVERAIRERVAAVRPDMAVLGEEEGEEPAGASGWRWVVDPIDATANYVRGVPVWATLLGLEHHGQLVAGIVSAPALGRRWWAERGGGAFADGQPIRVSRVAAVEDAHLAFAGAGRWAAEGKGEAFLALLGRCWRARGFGDFWMHLLVAEGAVDAAFEPVVEYYDVAAVQVIVEEAGGRFTDLHGRARADGGSAVSSNGLLHDAVLAAMGRGPA
jgi:histidinol-phosphatase